MRVIVLANNWVGWKVCQYLQKQNDTIVALGLAEKTKQRYAEKICSSVSVIKKNIFTPEKLRDPEFVESLRLLKADYLITVYYGYILAPRVLSVARLGAINFHYGYLPFNRGMHATVWPFIEGTPGGVALHFMDNGIDTGDIVARMPIEIEPVDTAYTYYEKTRKAMYNLFRQEWPNIKKGKIRRITQQSTHDTPTFHYGKEIDTLDPIDLKKSYTGEELINRLRARSYPDRYYSYYIKDGKKVFIKIQLSYNSEGK